MIYAKCYIDVTLNVTKLIVNVSKSTIMKISIKKKSNFVPLTSPSVSGESANQYDIIDDAVIASLSVTNRLTVDGINAANPLNLPTPFANVPEVVEGSEN